MLELVLVGLSTAADVVEQVPQCAGSLGTDRLLEVGQDRTCVAGESLAGMRQRDEAAALPGWVRDELEQAVAGQSRHEVLCRLPAGAEPPGQGRRCNAIRSQVREHEGLSGAEPGPALLLESVEQLVVEPPAGPEQQQRERRGWHCVRLPDRIAIRWWTEEADMRVVVLGAAGGVGSRAVTAALALGWDVVAAARSSVSVPAEVESVAVDVRDAAAVHDVLRGADAVLWCVGVTKRSGPDVGRTGLAHVVAGMEQHGVDRLVSVSGAGVTLPGDAKGVGARLVSGLTRRLARDLVQDKEGEHAVLEASRLSWTEVRPPRLVDREGTGRWALVEDAPGLTAKPVAKADVALAMLDLAGSQTWVGRSPFLVAG